MANNLQKVDVSVLIVCYNSLKDIERCLSSFYRYLDDQVHAEVLLLDNSNDGTVPLVKEKFKDVIVIDNDQNLGFGGGNNLLAKYAKGDYILLLNPDTELTNNSISRLLGVAKQFPDHGTWGGATFFPNGNREYTSQQFAPSVRNELIKLLGLGRFIRDAKPVSDTEGTMAVLSGAFMMVPKDIWDKVGGFDTDYFLYSEDVDLCLTISQLTGKLPIMSTYASVIHYVGQSSSNGNRTIYVYKGRMHLDRKNHGFIHNIALAVLLWLYALTRWSAGIMLSIVGKTQKGRYLRESYGAVLAPWRWFKGYPTSRSQQTATTGSGR